MAYIFYQQNLIEDNLHCLDKSVQCATMQNDTVVILNSYARKMAAYEKLRMPDSVVAICENIYERFYKGHYRQMASCFFGLATDSYLLTGNTDRAKELLDFYERESGYFDKDHNIEKGREAFYKLKGKYYMAVEMYDSAEVCFRKELLLGHDFNNQNMASNGLARVYQMQGRSDSAAKYALYAYDMNDSIYTRMATSEIAKAKEMYNYGRFQQLAIREKEKSEQMERWAWMLGAGIFITLVIVSFIWYKQRKRRKANEIKYHETLKSLYTKKEELKALQSQVTTLSHIIEDKEETIGQQADMMEKLSMHADELSALKAGKEAEIEQLRTEIEKYQTNRQSKNLDVEIAKMLLEDSPAYQNLQKSIHPLSDEEWLELEKLSADVLKEFSEFVSSAEPTLSIKERNLCILLRMNVKAKEASNMMNVSPSAITKTSKAILRKRFGAEGSTKDLIEKLSKMC